MKIFACLLASLAVGQAQLLQRIASLLPQRLSASASISLPRAPSFTAPRAEGSFGISLEQLLEEEWGAFKATYNKRYQSVEEENHRREIFITNRHKIAKFNMEYGEGKRSFVQQLNGYADLLFHEFDRALNGFNRTGRRVPLPQSTTFIPSANVVLPDYVDWREVGAVSPVKSQELCAACWAFAAAGALEGHNFRKKGTLVEVSPQNLVDCTKPQGNDGCEGGLIEPAFEYVKVNPGVDDEPSYPFEARDADCRFRPENIAAECTGYVSIAPGDEKGLEAAVATLGPVAVAIYAGSDNFQFYSGGVYYDQDCRNRPEDMNHAVLVVGYGTEANGLNYWLIKNSYGPNWGIGGYIKMAKDQNNHCGIATQAVYPLV